MIPFPARPSVNERCLFRRWSACKYSHCLYYGKLHPLENISYHSTAYCIYFQRFIRFSVPVTRGGGPGIPTPSRGAMYLPYMTTFQGTMYRVIQPRAAFTHFASCAILFMQVSSRGPVNLVAVGCSFDLLRFKYITHFASCQANLFRCIPGLDLSCVSSATLDFPADTPHRSPPGGCGTVWKCLQYITHFASCQPISPTNF